MEINIILCESGCGIFDLHLSFISLRFKWKLKEKNKRSITELALILFMRALARIAETTTMTHEQQAESKTSMTRRNGRTITSILQQRVTHHREV